MKYLDQAIAVQPNFAPAVFELADLQLELGSPVIAGQVVDHYLAIGLASPDVLLVGLRAALARDDRPVVQSYARRLRKEYPDSVQTKALPQLLGERG